MNRKKRFIWKKDIQMLWTSDLVCIETKYNASCPQMLLQSSNHTKPQLAEYFLQTRVFFLSTHTYAVESSRGMVIIVVVPKAARSNTHILKTLLTDKSLHNDFVAREIAFIWQVIEAQNKLSFVSNSVE